MKNKFQKQIEKLIYKKYVLDQIGGNAQTNLIQSTQNQLLTKRPQL